MRTHVTESELTQVTRLKIVSLTSTVNSIVANADDVQMLSKIVSIY